ncbi:hypothetical protein U1Q18_052330, partial [Sarracenia purpurea var. burkii]
MVGVILCARIRPRRRAGMIPSSPLSPAGYFRSSSMWSGLLDVLVASRWCLGPGGLRM